MRKTWQFLLVTLAFCSLPSAAHGQWASACTEHDWRVTIGGRSFGLVQKSVYTVSLSLPGCRYTTIYLGPVGTTTTRLRAPYVAAAPLLPLGAAGIFLAWCLIGRNSRL
jgi:hypothetical protein